MLKPFLSTTLREQRKPVRPRSAHALARGHSRRSAPCLAALLSPRRIHRWHHEAPEAARPLQCPCDRMLVRCCTPSPRSALSTAGIWPPAGQAGAPLLENASLPATGQLSSAALHQPVRKATAHWTCSNALHLRGRLDRIYIIDLVEAPLSVSVLPHLRVT